MGGMQDGGVKCDVDSMGEKKRDGYGDGGERWIGGGGKCGGRGKEMGGR